MNKIYKLFFLLSIVAMMFTSCSPDAFTLGAKDVNPEELVEGIAFKIEHDATNPNIIYLTSLMGSKYTPLWNHPQGRSQEQKVTLKIPFAGTYKVQFGVETRGGVVYGDTVSFTVDAMYADFISDPLWTSLTGGVGKEKVWIADNGKYGMAPGAMSYADPSSVLEFNDFTPNWEPTGNANGSTDTDMGWGSTMTFGLKGNAGLTTHKINEGGKDEVGTFSLNVDNHTLTTTDATILRPDNFIASAANWNLDLKVLTLTDNQLRVAIMRTNSEGSWWFIFNYVSKTYADAYVPTNQPDPTPNIGGDANSIMTTSNTKTWRISDQSPYNWTDLTGGLLNNWSTAADYAATGWAPYDADVISGISFTFTAAGAGAGAGKYSITAGDSELEGTYAVNSENVITFSNDISFPLSGWVSFATTAEKKLKIIKTKTDALGNINEMWLGNRSSDPVKKEYQVFHLVLGSGTSTVDAAKELKKLLTNSGTLKYSISTTYPFCWATGTSKDFNFTEMPSWTNWTGSETNLNNIAKVALTFSTNGTVEYVDNLGAAQSGTFSIISGDKADGENLIVFSGININFEMTGVTGGWVNCNFNKNVEGTDTNAKLPASNFWELYKWEYDATGKVSGVWFGKQTKVVTGGAAGERTVYHFVVTK